MEPTAVAPETLGYPEARRRVLGAAAPLSTEEVPLREARARALGRPVKAGHDLPPFRNASMDGIAARSVDLAGASGASPVSLLVTGTIAAGQAPDRALGKGQCVRIMTGAMLPEGADAVVPVEDLEGDEAGGERGGESAPARAGETEPGRAAGSPERVRVPIPAPPGLNVRGAGEDARAGEVVLAAGRDLSPHDVALLASLGEARVLVGRRPRVAALSTGDELLPPESALRPGAIRDSNLPMLEGLLSECGATVHSLSRLGDDPGEVADAIQRALEEADVVITVGGVSAGSRDPVKLGIGRIGGIALWRVAMKPGRPQAFGVPRGKLFFGLPGNPGSVACVFEALVRPALRKLQGFGDLDRPRLEARAARPILSRPGRTDFVRVTIEWREAGWWATEAGPQISGHVTPQARAHALLIVPEERVRLEAGDRASALLLRWPPGA